jgi:hypothetical protein
LLRSAFGRDQVPIPIKYRPSVWAILERLARSPHPSFEAPFVQSDASHSMTAPFNITTCVQVLDLVFSYGIWIIRDIIDRQPGITSNGANLGEIPEVRQTLEAYLDVRHHPAAEVWAFFGRRLPSLAALDLSWVERNLSNIFPRDEELRCLSESAWRGYILWNSPNRRVFRLIWDLYGEAVDRIQPTAGQNEYDDSDCQLARHLMILYWHGEVEAEGEGNLLSRFFAQAPDALRAEAIRFLGRSLGEEDSIPEEVMGRLDRLWEIRIQIARDRADCVEELTAFGAWFASRKFDERWALAQLTLILSLVGKAEPEDQIVEWLAEIAPRFPMEAVRCLQQMAEGCGWDYHVDQWMTQANVILSTALRDPRSEVGQAAADLINTFGSRGYHQFRNLLQAPTGPLN